MCLGHVCCRMQTSLKYLFVYDLIIMLKILNKIFLQYIHVSAFFVLTIMMSLWLRWVCIHVLRM